MFTNTVCPRCLDPFYIITSVKTSMDIFYFRCGNSILNNIGITQIRVKIIISLAYIKIYILMRLHTYHFYAIIISSFTRIL